VFSSKGSQFGRASSRLHHTFAQFVVLSIKIVVTRNQLTNSYTQTSETHPTTTMIGIKQTLLIASSVLLVLSVSGPANAATPPQQGRRVAKGMELTMSMSTKGSGKGGKGGKGSDDIPDIAPMSMPGSSKGGKGGKGKGGSKSDSSMDSSKDSSKDSSMDSSKSSKSSKKGEDGAKKSKKDKKSKKGGEGGMPAGKWLLVF
jgi:hypothetical protein